MRGALPATQQFYAEISSQFVPASASGGSISTAKSNTTSASVVKASAILDAHVNQAVNGITTGALSAMVEGEKPAVVVTTNIRAKMESQIVSNQTMAPLAPPQSLEEAQYGAPQPIIQVVGSNLLKCNFGGGYAQTSSVQFGSNPHQGSTSINSPLLQFGSRSTTKIPKSVQVAANQPTVSRVPSFRPSAGPSRTSTTSPNHVVSNPIPAYYVILPLIGNKHYNLTQYRLSKGSRSLSNYSIPACSLYVGGKYVPCGACNISSFTMVNVTYGCYDISVLCPATTPSAVTVRRLEMYDEPDDYHRNGGGTLDVGGPRDEDEMDISIEGLGWNSHSYIPPIIC